jgi:hypothetical protein
LQTCAEFLFDRIEAGEDGDALGAYLVDVQTRLDMTASDADLRLGAGRQRFDSQSRGI